MEDTEAEDTPHIEELDNETQMDATSWRHAKRGRNPSSSYKGREINR